jgi:CheY-like chemotaxis protein
MSLVGNLEDLGLVEILQIVSLGRNSGTLSLKSDGREASVVFRQGQVVRASSGSFPQSLGELLTSRSVIDPTTLRKALSLQQSQGFIDRLGTILVKHFGISPEKIEDVVREQVELVVLSLFDWSTGSFDFVISDRVDPVYDTRMDPLQFMLEQGLNPQLLALEGARTRDEKQQTHGGEPAGPDSGNGRPDEIPQSGRPGVAEKNQLIIVDDDGPTLQALAAGLRERGYVVHAVARSEEALIKVDGLIRSGQSPTVLIDLIMPKMDGSGVLGGVELLELLQVNFRDLPMIVMTDYHHAEAEGRVRELGCPFMIKPRRAEIGKPEPLHTFLTRLANEFSLIEQGGVVPDRQQEFNLGDELRLEMGDADDSLPPLSVASDESGSLSLLRSMLEELNTPDLQGGVLLILLRFASEFLNRAIVFTVNDRVVSGSGQFGITGGKLSGDEKVRAINFPLESGSMFSEPALSGRSVTLRPRPTPVDSHIFEQLGGGVPGEVFVGPLVSDSRLIGFLYGDNLPDATPIEGSETLAIFLTQAALAMDRTLPDGQKPARASQ